MKSVSLYTSNFNMKNTNTEANKIIKHTIGFSLLAILVIGGIEKSLSYLVSCSGNAQTGKVNLVMTHKIDPNLVIFGSSVAEVGFNSALIAKKLNKTVYNLALDGTPILKSECLIDEFLSYNKNCDTILIGLVYLCYSEMEGINMPSRFLAHKSNKFVIENFSIISPNLTKKLNYAPFYSFIVADQNYYKNAFIGLKNLINDNKTPIDPKMGFLSNNAIYVDTRNSKSNLDTIHIIQKSIDRQMKILSKIKSKGITPILVITPMHINGQRSFVNFESYTNTAKKIALKTNTRIIDFSQSEIAKNNRYFYNNGHLNSLGARSFTLSLCDSLTNFN